MEAYKITILSLITGIALAVAPVARAETVVIADPAYERPAAYYGDADVDVIVDDDAADDDVVAISQNGMGRCAATFRSFDPATGTYTGYDGLKRLCPYLE